jgi:hypothetical protein
MQFFLPCRPVMDGISFWYALMILDGMRQNSSFFFFLWHPLWLGFLFTLVGFSPMAVPGSVKSDLAQLAG